MTGFAYTTYADTFWDSPNPDAITEGINVPAGSLVKVLGQQGVFALVTWTNPNGFTWHKAIPTTALDTIPEDTQ